MVSKKEGILFIVSGPSGVGKGTVINEVLRLVPDINLSISYTTRPPRKNEINGKEYFFVNEEEFTSMIERGEFLEWARVHGNLYGTPKKYIEEKLKNNEDVILEIDTQGARQVKRTFPNGVFIFILPPSIDELLNRLHKRGTEKEEEIRMRLNNAKEEFKEWEWYNYTVINESVSLTGEIVASIIKAERCRTSRLMWKDL
ncbi:MAG: guanylate kinase [bacterium]|nr:guanylate kinase [bacterium]